MSEQQHGPAGAAAEAGAAEVSRQTVIFLFGLLATPIVVRKMMQQMREASGPDSAREDAARWAARVERFWQQLGRGFAAVAAWCWDQADQVKHPEP